MRNPEEETTRWRKEKREKRREFQKRISKEWNPIVVGGESFLLQIGAPQPVLIGRMVH